MSDTLNTDPTTGALSRLCANSFENALQARTALLADTIAYAARLIRDVLPTAAAITVDCEEKELHEVRDAQGETLWWAPASAQHAFNDGLVDDVDDLFREAIPFGGLAAAGWRISYKGEPYRDVQLPEPPPSMRHARAHVRHEGLVCDVHADLAPARVPSFTLVGPDSQPMPEARDRVRAAIINAGYAWPRGELTVSLNGSGEPDSTTDLAIACAILAAAGHVDPSTLKRTVVLGELRLDGRVRSTPQTRAGVRYADICGGYKRVIVASTAAATCPLVPGGTVQGVLDLPQTLHYLTRLAADDQCTPGEAAGNCAQCDRPLVWDRTGTRVNDEWGEYLCASRPAGARSTLHVLTAPAQN
ncbi:magnesium chelatase domain-containing protein [Streptomyces carpinensis]|uniref:Magnesium chelatase domain-containing protein n=1 Tax=Streptomyces carpinensis TaxID=66369 RepID=A0ABV1W0D8_9ACTN|nr:magnesium chelatase domain-containing protein [Streptomyces carpinensis]